MPLKNWRHSPTADGRAGCQRAMTRLDRPHQANIRIIQGTAKKMGLPMDTGGVTVQDHGNTSAASIPLALSVGAHVARSNRAI